ncbi:MAG: MFS transporter [Spirochaetia bacterium]|jgi:MFS family permease
MKPAERRNFLALFGDFTFFGAGSSFASQATVLPTFIATLTSSAPVIGLSSTVANGAWLLPQLFAANAIAGAPRRKPAVLWPAAFGRFVSLALGPLVLALSGRPTAALWAFFILYGLFWALDGVASIAWLDLLGKVLSHRLRARLIGISQAAQGLAGVGAGVLVGIILSSAAFPATSGYALLLFLCGVCYTLSYVCFFFLREEPDRQVGRPLPWPAYFRSLWQIVRADPAFRRALGVSLLFSVTGCATPFYIIHGLENLHFPEFSVGVFTAAQVIGGIISALVLGWMGEVRGTRSVMRLWGVICICTPLIAWAIPIVGGSPGPGGSPGSAALMYAYGLVFVLVGAQGNAVMAGFINYVIELAPASRRTTYIGCANTLASLSIFAPLLGGWMLSAGASWPALFSIAAAGPAAGLAFSARVIEPRRRSVETQARS